MKFKNNKTPISIGLPCYNEENNILEVLEKVITVLKENFSDWEILIVDNNSIDKTVEIVEEFLIKNDYQNVKILKNTKNIFYSGSVQKIIQNSKYDIVGIMDSDKQYEPSDLIRLYEYLNNENFDLVIGYRKNRKDNILRKIVSKVFLVISKLLISNNLNDLNCGIRILVKSHKIDQYISHYINFCNPELFVRYKKKGLKIGQLVVNHHDRVTGDSIHNIKNLIRTFFIVLIHLLKLKKIN